MRSSIFKSLRILLILSLLFMALGMAYLFHEIRILPTETEKREAVVRMLKVIFLGGGLVSLEWLFLKYLERRHETHSQNY